MGWTDDLAKYLRVHINEKFRDSNHPMNISYHEAKGETYITLDRIDYHFEFREVNGLAEADDQRPVGGPSCGAQPKPPLAFPDTLPL